MAILLKTVMRKNPLDKDAAPKFYPVQKTVHMVDETTVAEEIADETTLNPAEALMAIRQLRKILLRELMNSNSVKLGNWGSFGITLSTQGADTPEQVKATHVKQVKVNFTPGTEMKEALQKARFEWIDPEKKKAEEGSGTSGKE